MNCFIGIKNLQGSIKKNTKYTYLRALVGILD
jgi:hypothetical protein